jgi:hypothetical protein
MWGLSPCVLKGGFPVSRQTSDRGTAFVFVGKTQMLGTRRKKQNMRNQNCWFLVGSCDTTGTETHGTTQPIPITRIQTNRPGGPAALLTVVTFTREGITRGTCFGGCGYLLLLRIYPRQDYPNNDAEDRQQKTHPQQVGRTRHNGYSLRLH